MSASSRIRLASIDVRQGEVCSPGTCSFYYNAGYTLYFSSSTFFLYLLIGWEGMGWTAGCERGKIRDYWGAGGSWATSSLVSGFRWLNREGECMGPPPDLSFFSGVYFKFFRWSLINCWCAFLLERLSSGVRRKELILNWFLLELPGPTFNVEEQASLFSWLILENLFIATPAIFGWCFKAFLVELFCFA